MEKERCNCVLEPSSARKSRGPWISCALDSPKKPLLSVIPISSCWGYDNDKEQEGFPISAACDNTKGDKKNGWKHGPGNSGSAIRISLRGSFYISKLEIQNGLSSKANWKEFRIWVYNGNGVWRFPKNFIVTDKDSNILSRTTTDDGSKIKLTGKSENNIIVTFDVIEGYRLDIYVDASYMPNGNAMLNEITIFGPGTMITYISIYILYHLQNALVLSSVQ